MTTPAAGERQFIMRSFMLIYTVAMISGSVLTLALVPQALRDLGREKERLKEAMPDADMRGMLETGYRLNTFLLLVEIFYYYLLLRFAGDEWQFLYGGFFFGVIHIFYLVTGRLEKKRLAEGHKRKRGGRFLILMTATFTSLELFFLFIVGYLLLEQTG